MSLDAGLVVQDIHEAARLTGEALALDLESAEDGELGGLYFRYDPRPVPETGIASVRVRRNDVEGIGWSLPERKDLPFFAEVGLRGVDMLELGRVAAALESAAAGAVTMAGYSVVTVGRRDPPVNAFWRAHMNRFSTAADGAARWRVRAGAAARRDEGRAAHGGAWCIQPSDGDRAPDLLCHVTFGFETSELEQARRLSTSIFDVTFDAGASEDMGGAYLEARPPVTRGAISTLLVRSNAQSPWTWLYPQRREHRLLLDVTLITPNLLEPGRIAAAVEGACGEALRVVAYRVAGDLVRDRVPRMLEREFASQQEAASTWRFGHERSEARDNDDEEEIVEDEDEPG